MSEIARWKFDEAGKEAALRVFAATGNLKLAAEAAGVSANTVNAHLRSDPEFRGAWTEARLALVARLEQTAMSRAIDGWLEPKALAGDVVDVRRFDNRLLLRCLERHDPKHWSPRSQQKVESEVKVRVSLGLDKLSAESRADLRRILARERAAQVPAVPEPVDAEFEVLPEAPE